MPRMQNAGESGSLEDDIYKELDPFSMETESRRSISSRWTSIYKWQRQRKMLLIVVLSLPMLYLFGVHLLGRERVTPWKMSNDMDEVQDATNNTGLATSFHKKVIIHELDSRYVPGGDNDPEGHRRLIFIGDVHGCMDQLQALLKKIDFSEESDHLILAGDIVTKGPDSVKVLDELIRLKSTTVRGNHEDRLLNMAETIHKTEGTTSPEQFTDEGNLKDARLLRKLKKHHLDYLRATPLILQIAPLPRAKRWSTSHKHARISDGILVVHAGLVPGVALTQQDPYFVMNMRSIHQRTFMPSAMAANKHAHTKPWFEMWNEHNDKLHQKGNSLEDAEDIESDGDLVNDSEETDDSSASSWSWIKGSVNLDRFSSTTKPQPPTHPQVVVYGHDSKTGLQDHKWSKGLDSGCVSGGRLSAMILDATGKTEIKSVGCRDVRS